MRTVTDAAEETARGMPRIIQEDDNHVWIGWPVKKTWLAQLGPFFGSLIEAARRRRKPPSEG